MSGLVVTSVPSLADAFARRVLIGIERKESPDEVVRGALAVIADEFAAQLVREFSSVVLARFLYRERRRLWRLINRRTMVACLTGPSLRTTA